MSDELEQEVDRTPLVDFRQRLDGIDDEIMALFAKRYRVRDETMEIKREHNMPIIVEARVDEVIKRMTKKADQLDVPVEFAKALYKLVIDYSHRYEEQYRATLKEEEEVA